MRTTLTCLFAALVAVGCGSGGGDDGGTTTPPPTGAGGNKAVVCQTPPSVGTNGTVDSATAAQLVKPTLVKGKLRFNISVDATDGLNKNNKLTFEIRSTDGLIQNLDPNKGTAVWVPPPGGGLHFIYALAKNGNGGYTQRRIAVSLEDVGEILSSTARTSRPDYAPPASPEPNCFPFRSIPRTADLYGGKVQADGSQLGGDAIQMPGVDFVATQTQPDDPNNPPPPQTIATTDLRGSVVLNHVPPGTFEDPNVANLIVQATADAAKPIAGIAPERSGYGVDIDPALPEAKNDVFGQPLGFAQSIRGRVLLANNGFKPGGDSATCGIVNEFFDKQVTGTAQLFDNGQQLLATRTLNYEGHYAFPPVPGAASVRITCDGNVVASIALVNGLAPTDPTIIKTSAAPIINAIHATAVQGTVDHNGNDRSGDEFAIATAGQGVLSPFSGGQSDNIPDDQFFLDYKGIDTALSACMYYRAIGAVTDCGPKGELINPITMADWATKMQININPGDKFNPAENAKNLQPRAKFINALDLNLARDHTVVSHKAGEGAGIVCNYLGAGGATQEVEAAILKDPTFPDANGNPIQNAINTSVQGMIDQKNLVACVAMDHTSYPNVNGGKPFTTFLIFNAAGDLLPRINLDGRTEKFVPGTCVICHGGTKYAGKFPEDGTGAPDIGTHMLPFIVNNFNFPDNTVKDPNTHNANDLMTRAAQEAQLAKLNFFIRDNTGATIAAKEDITGWYAKNPNVYDNFYTPDSWKTDLKGNPISDTSVDAQWYQQVYKADCMGCHINQTEKLDFDHRFNLVQLDNQGNESISAAIDVTACGNVDRSASFLRNFAMPNALRTFDLYWGSGLGAAKDSSNAAISDLQKRIAQQAKVATISGVANKLDLMAQFVQAHSQRTGNCALSTTPLH